jgi:deoxyhypusine synthase
MVAILVLLRAKITWGKIDVDTPTFVVESDATIVAPLLFAYLLDL